jgi:cysteinyl-tRNA synthetase
MHLRLYNTLAKKEEDFVPINSGEVRMYTCGPTVYSRPHIGNYSSFLMADLLRRWLEVGHGYKVTHVKNITDVGHLSEDEVADAQGMDKIERQARQEKTDPLKIAKKYTMHYLADEEVLHLKEPEHRPKATETISEMIAMVSRLIKNGHAYETDDGVYFAVESFPSYGKLSGNIIKNINAGSRIAVKEHKKHPADFALWKKCVGDNEKHVLRWGSPWGEGFPGWHIECSCMSEKFLGSPFDIHTGGEDLIFPHHECEIAQSECSGDNKSHVRYWVHKRFIDMGDMKMSKRLGNVITIPDIIQMGYSPLDLRYYLLSVQYRTNLKFSVKGLADAAKARKKIIEWMREGELSDESQKSNDEQKWRNAFINAMNDDLNTPAALASVFGLMAWSRRKDGTIGQCKTTMRMIRKTFGCFEDDSDKDIPSDVCNLVEERGRARAAGDFAAADALRDDILALGYEIRDGDHGPIVQKNQRK